MSRSAAFSMVMGLCLQAGGLAAEFAGLTGTAGALSDAAIVASSRRYSYHHGASHGYLTDEFVRSIIMKPEAVDQHRECPKNGAILC